MVELNKSTIIKEFFKNLYNKEIDAKVYYITLNVDCNAKNNVICINKALSPIDQEMAYVIGMSFLYQAEGYTSTLPINRNNKKDEIYDIDSRIVQLLYAYEVFGEKGVEILKEKLYKGNAIFNPTIKKCITSMKQSEVKSILMKDIEKAYGKYAR